MLRSRIRKLENLMPCPDCEFRRKVQEAYSAFLAERGVKVEFVECEVFACPMCERRIISVSMAGLSPSEKRLVRRMYALLLEYGQGPPGALPSKELVRLDAAVMEAQQRCLREQYGQLHDEAFEDLGIAEYLREWEAWKRANGYC